ncbi:MAG: acyltransferase family protein [Planctomycetota bacterium]|nr:acyltransferase family protein [Planctomycetota bacterium]
MTTASPSPRRHDLDALRAIAMLLGILLHATMPFVGLPEKFFPLQDVSQAPWMGLLLHAIHGFRMPLFFLISGFFCAMLWRKRGLAALISHRFQRIFLPLLIGMFTIIPATWVAYSLPVIARAIAAEQRAGQQDNDEKGKDPDSAEANQQTDSRVSRLFEAIGRRDETAVRELLEAGVSPDSRHPRGYTALNACNYANTSEINRLLLDQGADPSLPSEEGDRNTPLHESVFWGQSEIAEQLLEAGADHRAVNLKGATPAVMATVDIDLAFRIAQLIGLRLSKEEIERGRERIGEMLEVPRPLVPQQENLMAILMYSPVFHHLWFLWYLCWLVAAFAIWAGLLGRFPLPRVCLMPPVCFLWLLPVTWLFQNRMGVMPDTFGPDTALGLVPVPSILGYYAVFFFYGAWYFDCDDESGKLGRSWMICLPLAMLVVFPLGIEFTTGDFGFAHRLAPVKDHRFYSVLLQVAYVWLMTVGSLGLFRSCFRRPSSRLRYLSDSSYWLYLAHLPLLTVVQFSISGLPIIALVKMLGALLFCTVLLLLSYEYGVRYTFVGTLLNGPRTRNTDN